jgi:hypothetical protein
MTNRKIDKIIALDDLFFYPGAGWLDTVVHLPWTEDTRRRVWLMIPESSPTISVDDVTLEPGAVLDQKPRWIDYGAKELPIRPQHWYGGEFHQLRIHGMQVSECGGSYLVISADLGLSMEGLSGVEDVERALWGLARCDAGTTTLRPSRVPAGSGVDFVVRYFAGPQGLPAGALVRFNVTRDFSRPQISDAGEPGFVSIVNADCELTIVAIEQSMASGIGIVCRMDEELPPTKGFGLGYSVPRTYIYPVEFHETERRYPYSHLPPLVASVALSENHPFVSLAQTNAHSLKVVPGRSERLHLFLPGRRFASEELSLKGTFTDRYRNSPPSGPIDVDIVIWLESEEYRHPLGSPAEHFVTRHRFEIPLPRLAPGVYRAVAYRTGTRDRVASSNPLAVVREGDGNRHRVYWGEFHSHTEMSDGIGEYGELYRHAREEGCLEFAAATDHAEFFTDNAWLWMQDVTNSWNQPGSFVTLVGYETEGKQRDRNVYTSRSRLKLFRGRYPPTSSLDVVWGHFHGDENVVGGVHALLAHGVAWEHWQHHDPSVERFLEIYSMWGANDFRDGPLVPDWLDEWIAQGIIKPPMTANELLQKGAKLGFTGGGDCHQGHCGFVSENPDGQVFDAYLNFRCGMTAAVMPHLDRTSLVHALRNRTTYATTGARILLDFTASGLAMGSIGSAPEVECHAEVHGVVPLTRVEIIKDGRIAWSEELDELDVEIRWRDPEPVREEHYYYLHVIQADGHRAWSSPIWIGP